MPCGGSGKRAKAPTQSCSRSRSTPSAIPGAFKNALDWTVASGSLYRKPVALLSVAPLGRGANVRRALELVFKALDCDASYHSVPLVPADLDQDGELRDPAIDA